MDYLHNLTENFTSTIGNALPGVFGALIALLIGFMVASLVRKMILKLLSKTQLDEKLGNAVGAYRPDMFIARIVYYLIVIYTLIIVLQMLGVDGALAPLEDMLSEFVNYVPRIIAGGIIAFAGYMLASLGSEATGFVSERLESFGGRIGLESDGVNISKIVKQVVFLLIFIPILILAFEALNMKAISGPATDMLRTILNAIPTIIAAGILLGIFYVAGRYVSTILADILRNMGIDNYVQQMGITGILGGASISRIIGNIVLFFILFTGLIAAADKLDLTQVQSILRDVFDIAAKVFFGLLILLGGILISNIAVKAIQKSPDNVWMVPLVKFAIIGIFLAFALHTMGIAESIVNLAFGLILGSIAVAFALSFGLGGREAAGKQLEHFFAKMRNEK